MHSDALSKINDFQELIDIHGEDVIVRAMDHEVLKAILNVIAEDMTVLRG
jgi:hypothetical protein